MTAPNVTSPPDYQADEPAQLLDDVRAFIGRFCVFPNDYESAVVALWAAWTHMHPQFHAGPRLALLSPEAGSGKTRVLEVLDLLVLAPFFSVSPSVAALFRTVDAHPTTLLLDETDTIFTHLGKDDENTDLRGMLNVGYKLGATVPRCEGPKHEVRHFSAFAPAALAGLGDLPDTIMSRSIIIRMRRRAPSETVEPFRSRVHESEGHTLRDRLAVWAAAVGEQAGAAWPDLPDGVEDRPAEIWEPLIAVADEADGHWPDTARAACSESVAATADAGKQSLGIQLLADLRTVFADHDVMATEDILAALHDLAESPWSDLRGKPLDARGLARRLRDYHVHSKNVAVGDKRPKGYAREDLWDPWQRYLPALDPRTSATSATDTAVPAVTSGNAVADPVAATSQVADLSATSTDPVADLSATRYPSATEKHASDQARYPSSGSSGSATPGSRGCCEGGPVKPSCGLCPRSATYWKNEEGDAA